MKYCDLFKAFVIAIKIKKIVFHEVVIALVGENTSTMITVC